MSNIKFISHEEFPEDPYTKEIVYLLIDEKYRVAYARKQAKNGGVFWAIPTTSVQKEGIKHYYKVFMQDSSFLEQDIETFLEKRSWENRSAISPMSANSVSLNQPNYQNQNIPF